MPPPQTPLAPAVPAVSYGQVIEYIQGTTLREMRMAEGSKHRSPHIIQVVCSDRLYFSRPNLSCLIHPPTKRRNAVPISLHNKSVTTKTIIKVPARSDTSASNDRSKGTSSCLFYRRRQSPLQCIPRRFRTTPHRSSVSLRSYAT